MAKRFKPGGYDSSGNYTTDGAMRDSTSQFSVSFYAKFFSCVICSLLVVGIAFSVMNTWLMSIPAHARPPMMQNSMSMPSSTALGMSMDPSAAMIGTNKPLLGFSGNTFTLPKHSQLPQLKGTKRVKHHHVEKAT
jgi:hypothetical protein